MNYINRTLNVVTVDTKLYFDRGEVVSHNIEFFLEELPSRKRTHNDICEYAKSLYNIGSGGLKFIETLGFRIEEVSLRMSVSFFGKNAERVERG